MTPTEFMDLCLRIGVEVGYWTADEAQHPEDLGYALSMVMQAVGLTAAHINRKDAARELQHIREAADARP